MRITMCSNSSSVFCMLFIEALAKEKEEQWEVEREREEGGNESKFSFSATSIYSYIASELFVVKQMLAKYEEAATRFNVRKILGYTCSRGKKI